MNITFKGNLLNLFTQINKCKNYIIPNIMSICGYWYFYKLQLQNLTAAKIYLEPGVDTTDIGITHSFASASNLVHFIILSFLLTILSLIEYAIRKKLFSKNVILFGIPRYIKYTHTILFWIGMWFPVSRLTFALLIIIALPFVNLF